MGLEQWDATDQRWPLNDHDRRLLSTLQGRAILARALRALCETMQQAGSKSEQEAWL